MKYSNYDDDDNDNDRGLSLPVIYTMIAMAGIVLIVILVVVSQNTRSSNRKTAAGLTPTPVVEAVDLRRYWQTTRDKLNLMSLRCQSLMRIMMILH